MDDLRRKWYSEMVGVDVIDTSFETMFDQWDMAYRVAFGKPLDDQNSLNAYLVWSSCSGGPVAPVKSPEAMPEPVESANDKYAIMFTDEPTWPSEIPPDEIWNSVSDSFGVDDWSSILAKSKVVVKQGEKYFIGEFLSLVPYQKDRILVLVNKQSLRVKKSKVRLFNGQ